MIKAVLFDMDGTLLDTERLSRAAWSRALDAMGICIDKEQMFREISGMNIKGIRSFCLQRYGEKFPFDELRARRHAYMVEMIETDPTLRKEGVPEIFYAFKDMGIKLAVASSSSELWVRKCLGCAGVDITLFDAFMTGEKVERSKPDPEIFLRAAEMLDLSPEDCVVAEDSYNGVKAGHAAGMKTVMIPDLQPMTDAFAPLLWARIDSLEELPALIEKFNLESENT